MNSLIYKQLNKTPITITKGRGVWLSDDAGHQWLDSCGGVAVSSLGHGHPRVLACMREAVNQITWAHAGSFTTPAAEALADWLVSRSGGLYKAQFLSGGSEAVELALKIAWQYWHECGKPQKTHIIGRRQNYHGSTMQTLAVSGNLQRRGLYDKFLPHASFVSPCYEWRDRKSHESIEEYTDRLANELEQLILALGSHNVCAFIAETVVGSSSGAVTATPDYFKKIRTICDRHDILLILDEVMAGMGRTGELFAYQQEGIVPDIVAIGKGLAAGYQPISAVLINREIHDALASGSGVLANGQTHVNHPYACAVALEVQHIIEDDALLPKVLEKGELFREMLRASLAPFDNVGDIRGRGLFCGVEFVTDRDSLAPLSPEQQFASRLKAIALEQGLLIYPNTGTVDGINGQHVLFAPPFIASEEELSLMVSRFEQSLRKAL